MLQANTMQITESIKEIITKYLTFLLDTLIQKWNVFKKC